MVKCLRKLELNEIELKKKTNKMHAQSPIPVYSVGHAKGSARRSLKVGPFIHHSHLTDGSEVKPTSRTRSYIWRCNHSKVKGNGS